MGPATSADDGSGGGLPIEPLLPQVVAQLPAGGTLLLQAPPGAGKTTRVPLALLEALGSGGGQILMLEPRRLAARAAAERLAAGLGEPVGQRVGYRVRLESRCSAATRIEVLTDGLFLRRLQADPALEGVACVIFDEFHERGSEADLALALVREARAVLAPQLRLLVMSATLNLQPLKQQLAEATLLTSAGRSFPVAVNHQLPRPGEPLAQQVLRALEQHWLDQRHPGETVLVFLPGQRDIQQCLRSLEATPWGPEVAITPLHGHLSLAAQSLALAPPGPGGKVVLATSIAESSLTIPGVSLVIDSGLSRRSRFDPNTGMDSLVTVTASHASAEQRRGRAGRLGPGRCLRLWSPAEQHGRPAFDPPELLEADPAPLVLQLAQWGAGLGDDLPWLEAPPRSSLLEGQALLRQLGALDTEYRLSHHGRAMARLGVHPRLAHLLLEARRRGLVPLGCALAALLSERDPLSPLVAGADLGQRLAWLQTPGREPQRRQLQQLQRQLSRQLLETDTEPAAAAKTPGRPTPNDRAGASHHSATAEDLDPTAAAELVALAYPERVALRRPEGRGRYLTRGGRGAQLHDHDPLQGCEVLAIARADGAGSDCRIQLALPLPRTSLDGLAAAAGEEQQQVHWDPTSRRVRAECTRALGVLVLERRPWPEAPEELVRQALLQGLAQEGLELLPWDPASRQLQQRLQLAHAHLGAPWPDRSDRALLENLEDWLGDHLGGMRSAADLQQVPLAEALWSTLAWDRRRELEALLPTGLAIPSGRQAPLSYASGSPVLAVKLQEMFGAQATPTVLGGRLPVTVQLLSPAGRPAAITQDLAGFWAGAYQQVRAELRGRYPKHPWPEDPRQATATALTSRRQQQAQGR